MKYCDKCGDEFLTGSFCYWCWVQTIRTYLYKFKCRQCEKEVERDWKVRDGLPKYCSKLCMYNYKTAHKISGKEKKKRRRMRKLKVKHQ